MAFAFVNIFEASLANRIHGFAQEPEPEDTFALVVYQNQEPPTHAGRRAPREAAHPERDSERLATAHVSDAHVPRERLAA